MVATPHDPTRSTSCSTGRSAHSTAEQTEALYFGEDSALTRFANSQIHQNVREHDAHRSRSASSIASGPGWPSTNRLDEAGLREVVQTAIAIAERSAPNPQAAVLPTTASPPDG